MKVASAVLGILLVVSLGCSSVSNTSYPMADGTFRNQRVISDPHAFSPTHTRSWLEVCSAKSDKPSEPDYTKCGQYEDTRYATSTGFLDGLGAAALYSGAIVGGSALIGNGISHSGSRTTVNQSGGGANASTNDQLIQNQTLGIGHGRR